MLANGVELVKRIQLHYLNAGLAEDIFAGNGLKELLRKCAGAFIAIMARIFDQRSMLVEQTEIDAPGIHRDPMQRTGFAGSGANAFTYLLKQSQRVPVQAVRQCDRRIRKAVRFGKLQFSISESAEHGAAAFGSEVKGEMDVRSHERRGDGGCK